MDMTAVLAMLAILAVIGAFAGVLAGLLGVGGGIVLVPAFFYAFQTLGFTGDKLMQLCLATSLATIIVTSLRSLQSHNKKGAVDWDILKTWGAGIAIGAVIGVIAASSLRSVALQALFGGLAMVIGLYLAFGKSEWRLAEDMPKGPVRWILSPLVGFLSVLMGIGGGSFGVPLMTLYGRPIHRAVATAAGFGVIIAVPSVIGFLMIQLPPETRPPLTIGAVNLPAFGVVIAMTLLTAPLGARLAHATDPKPLKRIFGIFLLLVAANMLRKAWLG
ncbi:sulfite exporter TauE/SafE family protein [Pseudooceanicola nitratireducens]|uniref:sulfite exporter TauE/SafE family protein n=1 Tax=Pseudooceanicola nitratireducens TaxID=517719 RepID=UPI001C9610B5|nr:sulfite exporter TauE/SafE family protein [Pseudooceanicola nitratireducens]MBY6158707.1 sulfite exporter TauE/SafE family protein [Pseudooceanicola nitratireducens]